MNFRKNILLAAGLTYALLTSAHAQAAPGLQAISDLAQLNGQALACQDMKTASRAKKLMLAHAPKTAQFGTAFEEGTQQGFLTQTRSQSDCPASAAVSAQLDSLMLQLQANLPAHVQNTTPTPSAGTQ